MQRQEDAKKITLSVNPLNQNKKRIESMKKKYIKPAVRIITVEMQHLLGTSREYTGEAGLKKADFGADERFDKTPRMWDVHTPNDLWADETHIQNSAWAGMDE